VIPADVRRFVAAYIKTPDQLDMLLLLRRSAGHGITATEVSNAVYTVPTSAAARLDELVAHGFLVSDGGAEPRYSYQPSSDDIRESIDRLAEAYAEDRAGVIKLTFAAPADPAADLADAFRFKGRKD
jgi:hypothetical protein